jgi:hypothetical protein
MAWEREIGVRGKLWSRNACGQQLLAVPLGWEAAFQHGSPSPAAWALVAQPGARARRLVRPIPQKVLTRLPQAIAFISRHRLGN